MTSVQRKRHSINISRLSTKIPISLQDHPDNTGGGHNHGSNGGAAQLDGLEDEELRHEVSKRHEIRGQSEVVDVLVGQIVGAIEPNDSRQKGPGAKRPCLESRHLLVGVVRVYSGGRMGARVGLGGVEGGCDGHNELPPGQETRDLGQERHVGVLWVLESRTVRVREQYLSEVNDMREGTWDDRRKGKIVTIGRIFGQEDDQVTGS